MCQPDGDGALDQNGELCETLGGQSTAKKRVQTG
ncbi:hypothetical protein Pan216_33970 [Planctomycetes bacterium Pan216]|uniref:Uncharacterized protein n=1 Tax=Kolteria novifilia TaxID=2527975 RepID=A0A518B6C9_9BACT|nr:hypothetical protein Pan216_33970 [Planctomycetes bacterium Pan216]